MDANQKGTGDVKRFVKHWFAWIRESDEGSGTISGVALIAVAAIMLSAVASAGNLLLCLHRAQNAADLASVAAANALYGGSADPCYVAERTISGNNAAIGSCTIEGDDVLVEAQVGTQVPFVSHVSKRSKRDRLSANEHRLEKRRMAENRHAKRGHLSGNPFACGV